MHSRSSFKVRISLFVLVDTFWIFVIFCQEKKILLFPLSWKAIIWSHPLVIAPYKESVGLTPFDFTFTLSLPDSVL